MSMEKFRLRNICPAENKNLSEEVFIVLLGATAIPPHLLLSVNGSLFAITEDGMQMGSPLEKLVKFIVRKKIPTLFVEWLLPENSKSEDLKFEIQKNVSFYKKVVPGKVSCLFPIRDTVAAVYGKEMLQANFIFELLPMMEKKNAIGKVFSLNMEIVNGEFELKTYSEEQMREALRSDQFSQSENPSS